MTSFERGLEQIPDLLAWLRAPVYPGGKSPLDYLREKRIRVFRGLVMSARDGRINPKHQEHE